MKYAKKMILVSPGRESLYSEKLSELDKNMSRILKRNDITDKEKVQMYSQVLGKYLVICYNKTHEPEVERTREEKNLKRKHSEYENIELMKKRKIEIDDNDDMITARETNNDSYDSDDWADFDTSVPLKIDERQMDALNKAILKRTYSDFMNENKTDKHEFYKIWSRLN
jgi:hypothetical protein